VRCLHLADGARDLRPQQVHLLVQPLEGERAQGRVGLGEEADDTGSGREADHCVVGGSSGCVGVVERSSAVVRERVQLRKQVEGYGAV
jgi:hypothetical protein